jgi:hypothetical protein
MARSEYIYLVRNGDMLSDAVPLAAFTVKRELRGWLSRKTGESLVNMHAYRMRDGGRGAVVEISIDDILNGE